jgi:hypothetical protein
MTINTWYNAATNTYNVQYDGKRYRRHSYVAVEELLKSLIANMVAVEQNNARRGK